MKKKNILIIGAGIHGLFLTYYLKRNLNNKITIIEKKPTICSGSSNATQKRANRGYHYPRCSLTTTECKDGWNFFRKNFKRFFFNISSSFYLIEKRSITKTKDYEKFLKKANLPYKILPISKSIFKSDNINSIFKVFEGCFDHNSIRNYLKKSLSSKNIKIFKNFNLIKIKRNILTREITLISDKKRIKGKFDYIINATYGNTNEILKIFGFKTKKIKIQNTVIFKIYSKNKIEPFTVFDGKFITILPDIQKNYYLVYDVENSITYKRFTKSILNKRKLLMTKKIYKYLDEDLKFKFISSYFGKRPVPINDKKSTRATKFKINNFFHSKFINIDGGKYISAPMKMFRLSKIID